MSWILFQQLFVNQLFRSSEKSYISYLFAIIHMHQVAIVFPESQPKIYSQESAILSYGQALWSRCDQPGLHCFWVMAKSTMDRMVSAFVLKVALPSCTEGIEAHCLFKCPVTSAGSSARMCRSSYTILSHGHSCKGTRHCKQSSY
jgi:hypothetical protein